MSRTTTIQARVDPETKNKAQGILASLGINISEGICMFLRQVILHKGIPFEVKIPNKLTAKTLEDSEKGIDLHEVSNIDELFKD
ncbi:MAG: type II toxin-antitoxin system RelB/DinJ family antitoxin [Phycisphaerae bacterium]